MSFLLKILLGLITVTAAASELTPPNESTNITTFSLDLYKIFSNTNENTVISPLSLRILLSLIYQQASGQSELQLKTKLRLTDKPQSLASQKLFLQQLSSDIKIVNKAYVQQDKTPLKDFINAAKDFSTDIESINFKQQKRKTAAQINAWVEDQTNHLIKNLITPDVLADDTALLLINTIYFKALWKEPFNPRTIFKSDFVTSPGNIYQVDYMSERMSVRMCNMNEIKATVLEIPYVDTSGFVLWIVLPNKDTSLAQVEQGLSDEIFKKVDKTLHNVGVDVTIPRFEIETPVDGITLLNKMGIEAIFSDYQLNILENGPPLKVDELVQKTRIIIDSNGTEAATASYLKAVPLSAVPIFWTNRPFMFAVMMKSTNIPVFMGHFVKP